MILSFTLFSALLLIPAQAMPHPMGSQNDLSRRGSPCSASEDKPADTAAPSAMATITEAQILILAPGSKSCDGASFKDECRDATVAAKEMSKGFMKYNITSPGAKAALASLMAFESGDFKFNINHFPAPGRPGQGTRNMMMFIFVSEYAKAIKATEAGAIAKKFDGREPTPEEQNQIRALVLDDESSFASAAWYFKNKCKPDQQADVNAGTYEGWTKFIKECVNTGLDEGREKGYKLARQALELK